jgi:ATP-binding cassette subfamily B (MDR/TAP) protein 1
LQSGEKEEEEEEEEEAYRFATMANQDVEIEQSGSRTNPGHGVRNTTVEDNTENGKLDRRTAKKLELSKDLGDSGKNRNLKKKEKEEQSTTTPPKARPQVVAFYKLFSFADPLDYLLMTVGTIGSVANGLTLPIMTLVLGAITNAFGDNQHDSQALIQQVSNVALKYVYLGAGAAVASYLEVTCWMITGERQAARIRSNYLKAILRQDIAFFDKETSTGEVIGRMAGDTVLIQEAIGEKVGKFQQLVSTFLGGFVVAFIRGWKLTLVMLAVLPALVLATTIMAKLLSRLSSEGQRCYAEAGNTVQQVVSSIRTVSVHKTNNHQHP